MFDISFRVLAVIPYVHSNHVVARVIDQLPDYRPHLNATFPMMRADKVALYAQTRGCNVIVRVKRWK